ncbi:protein RGF1 INDUCIBLE TRANSCRIPTION FACTOR 1-like [Curcuma longa]|uniref:protein RGF1 INDUCIBLE TRANSCRIPTION FACTOR 1-like n=1 Tax=Curcuma longa TaxID=136217 RepID=UPI003D9FA804
MRRIGGECGSPAAAMPGWLGRLMEESFFVGCGAHGSRRKNEKNIFCLDCRTSICPHCAPSHPSHSLLQVRRYVYNDVVRLEDLERLIDCSYVQPYTINSAKVIFLKPRPQSRPFKGSGNLCLMCDRILQEPFHFCSLSCKVDHAMLKGEDLPRMLFRLNELDFAVTRFKNLREGGAELAGGVDDGTDSFDGGPSTGEKRHNGGFFPQIVLAPLSSRRKGAPQRSPLC